MKNDFKQIAVKLARTAGKMMLRDFGLGMEKEWKGDNTPVTKTDIEINKIVIAEIKKNFPTHDILAEEESDMSQKSEFVWVCDPIDGTIPFSHGIPTCVFSLALVKNGVPIFGVIYDPFLDRMFLGELGKGSTLNGKKIRVSNKKDFKGAVVNIPSNYNATRNFLRNESAFLMTHHSIAYTSSLISCGEILFTVHRHNHAHDCAAIKIIVEEAGGKVTDLGGNEQRYDQKINGCVASNGLAHEQIIDLIKKEKLQNITIKN